MLSFAFTFLYFSFWTNNSSYCVYFKRFILFLKSYLIFWIEGYKIWSILNLVDISFLNYDNSWTQNLNIRKYFSIHFKYFCHLPQFFSPSTSMKYCLFPNFIINKHFRCKTSYNNIEHRKKLCLTQWEDSKMNEMEHKKRINA